MSEVRRCLHHAIPAITQHHNADINRSVPIIVGVSGGVDSICLCAVLKHLSHTLPITPIVAHFNHQLRGESSDADALFVQQFAQTQALAFVLGSADVNVIAKRDKVSIEVAARQARYTFFAQTAQAHNSNYIFLAHHADDQAETLLLRLLRGTGIDGLQGMRPMTKVPYADEQQLHLVRPLLYINRAEIVAHCREHQLDFRHDASNDDVHHTRNLIRHNLLPLLERINPGIRQVLTHFADSVSTDVEIINDAVRGALAQVQISQPEPSSTLVIDRTKWCALSVGLQRRTLREVVTLAKGDRHNLTFVAIREACDVLTSSAAHGQIALGQNLYLVFNTRTFILKTGKQTAD
jgi:tRNA(Ile)-lysidine synthase